jgi:formate C-acetyltransferase
MDEEKYHNFGIHGTGLSTAADSLAAIEKYVFTEKSVTAQELIRAVDEDFANSPELLHTLRCEAPKMATGENAADRLAAVLLGLFADTLEGRKNCLGGCYRAGTGSAMFYLWHAAELGASPDGRRKGEPFSANYSPSLFARVGGPLSVVRSFALPGLEKTVNGGPLTLELSQSVFRTPESLEKVAALVQLYIQLGGHQLQLNAVNPELLEAAQKDPENYPHLIVRIWGWSAYFVELEQEYQDHVLRRQQYKL